MNYKINQVDPSLAKRACEDITIDLPEYFGIPEANEKYAHGMLLRTSFAAYSDANIIGLLTLEFPSENNVNIYWLAVKRQHQNNQVGKNLLLAAEKYCIDHHYTSLTVETVSPKMNDENYFKTYQFYTRCGFQPLFELKPYGPDLLMIYMIKLLSHR